MHTVKCPNSSLCSFVCVPLLSMEYLIICQQQIMYLLWQGLWPGGKVQNKDDIVSPITALALVIMAVLLCNSCWVWHGCIGLVYSIVKYAMGNT